MGQCADLNICGKCKAQWYNLEALPKIDYQLKTFLLIAILHVYKQIHCYANVPTRTTIGSIEMTVNHCLLGT